MSELEFQEIFNTFQPKIQRYLARLVGEFEAEDLTQDVFIKVGQGLKGFKGQSQLSTWIYKIATNTALDKLRSPSFHQTKNAIRAINEAELEMVVNNLWTEEKKPSIEQQSVRKEMNECIRDLIENLPENYSAVIVLSELEGMKNKEIAEVLDISLDTVKIRLHRAKTKLKKEMENHCNLYRNDQNELACDKKNCS